MEKFVFGLKFETAEWSSEDVPMEPGTLFHNVDEFLCLCLSPDGNTITEVHADQDGEQHVAGVWQHKE